MHRLLSSLVRRKARPLRSPKFPLYQFSVFNMSESKRVYSSKTATTVSLLKNTNQALGLAQYAIDFMGGKLGTGPSDTVHKKVELFHTDSVMCGVSALALKTNAPTVLREEAIEYQDPNGACVFGSSDRLHAEKAICANSSAVREWDSNGTVFGYNKALGHTAGEFGHNDFYPVVVAACQMKGYDGETASRAMILLDEIRGRLSEVFSLKTYKIDHVVHGAIASAATYGALMGATAAQIESAIGMVVAHYVPWRAIRAGHQLSDSKGASAAISTEVAIMCVHRCMRGFVGPQDIFRNPQSLFRQFEPTAGSHESPFNLVLSHSGDDFAVMGMHFKLGLYEHQSAGALQGLIDLLAKSPSLLNPGAIKKIKIVCYEPAFGIIGDPAKRDPHTRQSADHSMVYIVSSMLRKALQVGPSLVEGKEEGPAGKKRKVASGQAATASTTDKLWKQLMLLPLDYSKPKLFDAETRDLMAKIEFEHGGPEYDSRYPDGIPTSVVITDAKGVEHDSGLVMYPGGHARNTTADLEGILDTKFQRMATIAVGEANVSALLSKLDNLRSKTPAEMATMYCTPLAFSTEDHQL